MNNPSTSDPHSAYYDAMRDADEALAEFEACMAIWLPDVWGMEMRDVGYVHARSGAAQALLALGDTRRARELAEAELADVRRFGGRRALGVALRVSGLARAGTEGLAALEESVAVLGKSSAVTGARSVSGRAGRCASSGGSTPRRPQSALGRS